MKKEIVQTEEILSHTDFFIDEIGIKDFINNCYGKVLIVGLELGYMLNSCAEREIVEKVTVIEKDENLIELFYSYYKTKFGDKIEILQGDVYSWKPDKIQEYDCCWIDDWSVKSKDENMYLDLEDLDFKYSEFCKNVRFWGGQFSLHDVGKTWL